MFYPECQMPTAYIALGANIPSLIGSPEATLSAALPKLGELGDLIAISSFYRTAPVGFADQPSFVNAAVALQTTILPQSLLSCLLEIEILFGRDRSQGIPNGPRTLDLDLLLYGGFVLGTQNLQLPHPRLVDRAFVLVPLAEIAPRLIHPRLAKTMSQLLQELPAYPKESSNGIRLPSPMARLGASENAGHENSADGPLADPIQGR